MTVAGAFWTCAAHVEGLWLPEKATSVHFLSTRSTRRFCFHGETLTISNAKKQPPPPKTRSQEGPKRERAVAGPNAPRSVWDTPLPTAQGLRASKPAVLRKYSQPSETNSRNGALMLLRRCCCSAPAIQKLLRHFELACNALCRAHVSPIAALYLFALWRLLCRPN